MPKEHEYESEIKCPHCDYEFEDSWEYNDSDESEIECTSCDEPFYLCVHVEVSYTTNVLDCDEKDHIWAEAKRYDYPGDNSSIWTRECENCTESQYERGGLNFKNPWKGEDQDG